MASTNVMVMASGPRNNDPWVPLPSDEEEHPPQAIVQPAPENPLHQMIDSDRYIKNLERKLERLVNSRNAKRSEPTSRDIITSLSVFHDDQMRRYVNDTEHTDLNDAGTSAEDRLAQTSFVQRKLHPERQPLSAEELAELVKEDVLAKMFEDELKVEDKNSVAPSTSGPVAQSSSAVEQSSHDAPDTSSTSSSNLKTVVKTEENTLNSTEIETAPPLEEENWANFDEMNEDTNS